MPVEPSERLARHQTYTSEQQASRERFLTMSNREIATEVEDLLDGKLDVTSNDRVQYGAGIKIGIVDETSTKVLNAGGRFVSQSQLEDIAAHADQIRGGLADREGVRDSEPDNPSSMAQFEVAFIDQSRDARDFARDAAEARLTNELNATGGRIRRFARSIWKGNVARDYYLQKYHQEAEDVIVADQDVLTHKTADEAARNRSRVATIERFLSEYDADTVHEEAGERRLEALQANSPFAIAVKNLVRQYAGGDITSLDALKEERTRILNELDGTELVGEGKVRIDNIIEIACAVKGAVEHGDSLDRILATMNIGSGEARTGARTEADYNRVDKIIAAWETKAGGKASFVTPETIAAASSIAIAFTRIGRGAVLKATGLTLIPGPVAGVFAGLRENKRYKDERRQHIRESSEGMLVVDGSARREELEETRYDAIIASELSATLREHVTGEGRLDTAEAIQAALDTLSLIEARVHMSDSRNVDLISYSSAENRENERWDLDLARAEAKVALRRRLDATTRQALGMNEQIELDEWLSSQREVYDSLSEDIDQKDRLFKQQKLRRVLKAAAVTSVTGFMIGEAIQEGVATVDSSREGLIDQLLHHTTHPVDGETRQTLIMGWVHGNEGGGTSMTHVGPSSTYTSTSMAEGGHVEVSSEHRLLQHGESFRLEREGSPPINNLTMNSDGSMSQSTLKELQARGFIVEDLSHRVSTPTQGSRAVGIGEFLSTTDEQRVQVERTLWADNNTPAPVFDKNELGLDWSGGNAIDSQGVHMSVAGMAESGSYHETTHISWSEEAANGNLKALVSLTQDSQVRPFVFDVNPDGSIDIPPDSQIAKSFAVVDGKPVYNGAFVEIARITGVDEQGTNKVQPLATLVGTNTLPESFEVPTTTIETRAVHDYKITWGGEDIAEHTPGRVTEPAPFIPIVARRPLERLVRRADDTFGYRYGYGSGSERISREEYDEYASDFSPRIRDNSRAYLDLGQELNWLHDHVRNRDGQEYVDQIDAIIEGTPELAEMAPNTEMILTIPVRADTEGDNIYASLALYARQDADELKRTLVLLNVNWLDINSSTTEARARVQKTFDEIDRVKRDFPQLKIAVMRREYVQKEVDKTGGVVAYFARDMANAALFATRRAVNTGRIPADKDVIIVRNDADAQGISRHHFRSMIRAITKHPSVDIFKGVTRFGTSLTDKYPGFGVVVRMNSDLTSLATLRGAVHTGGANFGIRASTLAAVGGVGVGRSTGAGSDDVEVGRKISIARRGTPKRSGLISSYAAHGLADEEQKISMLVGGATIDTDGKRFLNSYLDGAYWQDVWDRNRRGGFSDAPGGHRARDFDKPIADSEQFGFWSDRAYTNFEHNVSRELMYVPETDRKRMLSLIFKDVPGAYRLGADAQGNLTFTLTRAGREHIRKWTRRDEKGRRRTVGRRQREALYGRKAGSGLKRHRGALVSS